MNIKSLFDLQSLEAKIKTIDERVNTVKNENNLSRLKEEYLKLKKRFTECEALFKENGEKQNIEKNEIEAFEKNIIALENIKYSEDINTVEKLDSIDREINALKENLSVVEDRMIKLIEDSEKIEKEIPEIKKKMNYLKKKHNVMIASVDSELSILNNDRAELETQRVQLQPDAKNEIFDMYKKVKRVHEDPVAWVQYRICSGCKIEIGALDYEKVKADKEMVRCQNCGRILIYNDTTSDAPSK